MLIKHAHKVKIKKTLRILIIILFPIVLALSIYLIFFYKQEGKIGAANVTDSFDDTTYIDIGNSSNYLIESGQLKTSSNASYFGTGDDGACTVSADTNINTGTCVGRVNGDAVNFSITSSVSAGSNTVTLSSTPTGLAVGDEILIINLQGTSSNYSNVGNYETAYITQIDTNTLTLDTNLVNGYDGTTQKIMVQRIPQYTNVTVNATYNFYPTAWNGTKGGVLMFRATGTVTVNGTIHANAMGYRGGSGGPSGNGGGGYGGESVTGSYSLGLGKGGSYGGSGYAAVTGGGGGGGCQYGTGGAGGVGGSGGGGGDGSGASAARGGGGAGAGYGSYGYGGGTNGNNGSTDLSGSGTTGGGSYGGNGGGGGTYGDSIISNLYLGSGGGGGGDGCGTGPSGGAGGGSILIYADNLTVIGVISSNGANGINGGGDETFSCGGGGGGSGGSVKLVVDAATLGSSLIRSYGGSKGTSLVQSGGNGGVGRIYIEYKTSLSGTTSPSASTEQLPAYPDTMVLQSADLISEAYDVEIKTFVYNLSAKPASTTANVQFSTDATNWYSSAGVLGASDSLTTGTDNAIDLSGLGWESQTFYYKVTFETNSGTATPVLDDITLGYDATPQMPTIGDPEALSISSIRWNFTDNASNETGFKLFDGSGTLVSTVETQNLSYIDETELSPNTQYTRKIAAYNALGNSDLTESKSIYTLASVPTISLGDLTISSVTLNAGNTSNLTSGSSGLFFDCVGETCDEGINEWVQTDTDTATGLSTNTQYTFKVRARNGDSVETSNSSNLLLYTLADIPTLSTSDVSTSSITLTAGNTSNLTSGSSGLYFDCTGADCDGGINEWTQSSADIVTGLGENTQYTFQVKARNGDATETEYSSSVSKYTLLGIPSILGGSVGTNQIEITASAIPNKGAGSTALYFDCTSENCDTGINIWVDSSTGIATGLTDNSVYEFRVKGRNADGIETEYSDTATFYTLPSVPTLSVTSVSTNTISLQATGVSNLTEGSSGIYFDCTGDNCDEGINNWVQVTSDTATGLSVNTQYTFVSKARSRSGIETADSNMVSKYTKANTPGTPSVVTKDSSSATIKVSANGNPSNTKYLIQEVNSGKYLNLSTKLLSTTQSWNTYSELGGSSGVKINGLNAGQTYIFRVKAKNGDDVETDYSATLSVTTLLSGPTMGTPETLSSTSIRWKFTDNDSTETGFKIVDSSNTEKVVCTGSNLTYCDETGLLPGIQYSRKVYSYNSTSQSPYSSIVSGYTYSAVPGIPAVTSTDSQSVNVQIDVNGNGSSTQYLIQESQTGRFVNISDGTLGTSESWNTYIQWGGSLGMDVLGLDPNETYIFRVKAKNGGGVTTEYSQTATVVTRANIPADVEMSDISSTSVKVTFDINSNPASTEYVIQDENSGMFVNPVSMNLVSTEVWGTYSVFGASDGITIGSLDADEEYSFRVKARNSEGVETAYSSSTGGTVIGARILNVPTGIKAVLSSNENIEVDTEEGRQFGVKNVRVKAEDYLIADLPISFAIDRDWRNTILEINAIEYKAVVKMSEDEGLKGRFIMYVISGDTNAFRLCPSAKSLDDIKSGCTGEVLFEGEFPQSKEVEGKTVTVSKAQLNGVTYWIVDGLSGTGGEGYTAEEESSDSQEEEKPVSGVLGDFGTSLKEITEKVGEVVENSTVSNLNEGQLQTVAATTSVITVTVGASVAAGGISQFLYAVVQYLTGVLNWFGFKRKKVQYGFVYDSYTKEPISGAVVRIYEPEGGIVDTIVTDEKGAFSGNLKPGIYKIEVRKRGFTFPSKLIKGKVDLPVQNIYHGGDFILSENDIVDLAIPLDSDTLDKNKKGAVVATSIFGNIFSILNIFLFLAGISMTIYMNNKYPSTSNMLLSLVYIPALYAIIVSFVGTGKKYGVVKDVSRKTLKGIQVGIREMEFDQIIAKRITDDKGKYRFVLPAGKYKIEILDREYLVDNIAKGAEVQSKKEFVINRRIVVKHK